MINALDHKLMKLYALKDLGTPARFLGINFLLTENGKVKMSHGELILELLKNTAMN